MKIKSKLVQYQEFDISEEDLKSFNGFKIIDTTVEDSISLPGQKSGSSHIVLHLKKGQIIRYITLSVGDFVWHNFRKRLKDKTEATACLLREEEIPKHIPVEAIEAAKKNVDHYKNIENNATHSKETTKAELHPRTQAQAKRVRE